MWRRICRTEPRQNAVLKQLAARATATSGADLVPLRERAKRLQPGGGVSVTANVPGCLSVNAVAPSLC